MAKNDTPYPKFFQKLEMGQVFNLRNKVVPDIECGEFDLMHEKTSAEI